jgi:hypothetical protein
MVNRDATVNTTITIVGHEHPGNLCGVYLAVNLPFHQRVARVSVFSGDSANPRHLYLGC